GALGGGRGRGGRVWAGHPAAPPPLGAPPAPPVGWPGLLLAGVFVLGLCLPFRPYLGALAAAGALPGPSHKLLLGLTAVLALVSLLIYPAYGSDLFDYIGFERMWLVYGDNPLTALPIDHPEDWAASLVWYPDR